MLEILQKKVNLLTTSEQNQLTKLILRHYPSAEQPYIDARVRVDNGFDIVLLKDKEKVLGVSYYNVLKMHTPFANENLPIVHFGQAIKASGYRGNIIWKLGGWYAQRRLGFLYPFRKTVGISIMISPKVYENFIKLFPHCHPNKPGKYSPVILDFINDYFQNHRKIDCKLDSNLCITLENIGEEDVTDDWERYLKAKNSRINELFIAKGIFRFENGRIIKTAKHLVACGLRAPMAFRRQYWFPEEGEEVISEQLVKSDY